MSTLPSAGLLSILVSFCMTKHWPAEELFRQAGHDLTALRLGATVLSPAQHLEVLAQAAQRYACPTVALELGQFLQSEQLGVFGTLLASCAHLQQAIERFNQFKPLLDEQLDLQLTVAPEGLWVRVGTRTQASGQTHPLQVDLLLSALLSQGGQFCGQPVQPLALHLRRSRPPHAPAYVQHLRIMPRFDQDEDALLLPTALLTQPFLTASQRLHEQVVHTARALTSVSDESMAQRVSRHLRLHLHAPDLCQLDAVAQAFGRSPRSLQRHLSAEQRHLQGLLDEVRHQQSCELLQHTLLPIEQIAWQVGFAHPSSLNEKFLRWTGMTPSQYRQQAQPSPLV